MAVDLLWPGALAAIAGVGVLRWSWSRKRRSTGANALGWGLLLLALALGVVEAGAWGIAIMSLAGMSAAALLLGREAAASPRGRADVSDRRARMLPEAGEPLRLASRILTFMLVVIGGGLASIALGIAVRLFTLQFGWNEADATATAFIAVPLAWGIVATIVLMQHRRFDQYATLAVAGLPLIPALLIGS